MTYDSEKMKFQNFHSHHRCSKHSLSKKWFVKSIS